MSAPTSSHAARAPDRPFEIKSADLPLVVLQLRSANWEEVMDGLLAEYGPGSDNAEFFDHDALVLDFSHLDPELPLVDLVPLLRVLRQCQLVPIALRGANTAWMGYALEIGLVDAQKEVFQVRPASTLPVVTEVVQEVVREVVHEVVREVPAPSALIVDKPLRSGQRLYARGGDIILLAMVNAGAEVVADGNIHVYAPLRGRAMAGARGNVQARIFSTCLEPELVSIAGVYRTSEHPLPPDIQGKAAHVRLSDDGSDKLLFEAFHR